MVVHRHRYVEAIGDLAMCQPLAAQTKGLRDTVITAETSGTLAVSHLSTVVDGLRE